MNYKRGTSQEFEGEDVNDDVDATWRKSVLELIKDDDLFQQGGRGSGFRGHRGRKGIGVGGSLPREAADSEHFNLTVKKSVIDKILQWSTSRYNQYRKKDVVRIAEEILSDDHWTIMWKDNVPEGSVTRQVDPSRWKGFQGDPSTRLEVQVTEMTFTSGGYTTSSNMGGSDWYINGKNHSISRGHAEFGTGDKFVAYETWYFAPVKKNQLFTQGGRGSGNFDHAGRPGKVGGSAPGRKTLPPMPERRGATTTRRQRLEIILKNINPADESILFMDPEAKEQFLQSHYQMFAESLGLEVPITVLDDNRFNVLVARDAIMLGTDIKNIRGVLEHDLDGTDTEIFLRRSLVRGTNKSRVAISEKNWGKLANAMVVSHETAFHEIGHAYRIHIDEIKGISPKNMDEYMADEHEAFANAFSRAIVDGYWSENGSIEDLENLLNISIE